MKSLKLSVLFLSVFAFVFGCSNKEQASSNEIVQWSEFISPTVPIYKIKKPVYDEQLKVNPLPMPFAQDTGPALYRERAQRYLLQGKSGYPDLLEGTLEQIYSYVAAGMAEPIENLFEADEDKDIIQQSLIDAFTINGHLYAFPNAGNVRLLIYRKDLLNKYNLKVPETWDELISVAKTLREKEGINGFMFTTQTKEVRAFQEFMSFYFTLADNIYEVKDGKATYIADKANFEKVLQLYKDLFTVAIDPNSRGQDFKAVDYGITGGQAAMITCGPWIWEHQTEEPSRASTISNLAVAPIPLPFGGEAGTYMEVKGYIMNPYIREDKKEAVYKAIKFLTAKPFIELEVKYVQAPSIRKDITNDNAFGQAFSDNLNTGKVLEFINWDAPQNYIIDSIQNVIYNRATPYEAATTLENQLKEYAPRATVRNEN